MRDIPVSVIVPIRNEERNLARCLRRLRGFSQVIVVDSGSTDHSAAIARAAGVEFLEFEWDGKFPKKRNWTLRNCVFSNAWVLFVDADECVTKSFQEELVRVLPTTPHAGFWVTYSTHFMGRLLRHGDKLRKLPLFRIGAGEYEHIPEERWSGLDMEVHEHPIIQGSVGHLKTPIIHNWTKGWNACLQRCNEYSDWEASRYCAWQDAMGSSWGRWTLRQRIKYAFLDSWLLGPLFFVASYFLKGGFLDGREGFMFAAFKMFYFFQVRCKILELRRRGTRLSGQRRMRIPVGLDDARKEMLLDRNWREKATGS